MNALENFKICNDFFVNAIDQTCKLDIPRITKRTSISNPWITAGIINYVTEKNRLYQVWTKSKSNNARWRPCRYMAYKEQRKIRCKTMAENFKADPRKTWSLINDLRGKGKTPPKSSFVIGGEV